MPNRHELKLLLATPIFSEKEYALGEWLEAARAYTYPHETLLVDNSENVDFYERWRTQTPIVRVEAQGGVYFHRLAQAAEYIRCYFLARDFDLWLNLDADEMGEPDLIDYLLDLRGDADCLNHASPNRQLNMWIDGGFGCALFNRRIMESISFADCPDDVGHDVWFYRTVDRERFQVKQTRGTRILRHLDGLNAEIIPHDLGLELSR